jgi:hypothetical protein
MTKRILLRIIFGSILWAPTLAQQESDLDQVNNKIVHHVATQMPGWQYRRGTPIQGSRDVIVEVWTFPNRIVKLSMMQRKSAEDARKKLMKFAQEEGDARELKGFGDEAYSWGDEGSNVMFRKGKYTFYIATIANVERDVDAQALTREQKRERRKSEMIRLSKELAKHVATAIDAP